VNGPELGFHVLLARAAAAGDEIIRRDLVVRDLPSGSLSLNDQLFDESVLRSNVQMALTTRAEKLMWIAADEHLPYGEVVSLISKPRHDTPDDGHNPSRYGRRTSPGTKSQQSGRKELSSSVTSR
jgi:hypothetical protein